MSIVVLQCVAVCCSVSRLSYIALNVLQLNVDLSVLQFIAVCCSVLQCDAVCCSVMVLQCVAACCGSF